jgi:hypothetical protein
MMSTPLRGLRAVSFAASYIAIDSTFEQLTGGDKHVAHHAIAVVASSALFGVLSGQLAKGILVGAALAPITAPIYYFAYCRNPRLVPSPLSSVRQLIASPVESPEPPTNAPVETNSSEGKP